MVSRGWATIVPRSLACFRWKVRTNRHALAQAETCRPHLEHRSTLEPVIDDGNLEA